MLSISKEKKKEHQRVFTPSVIEPSFGIGRIIYCLFEHSFYTRPSKAGDEQQNVFRFPPLVAPIKCTVFPLVQNQQFDTGTSIGKRYARTVDSADSVTIRERDSKDQIRVKLEDVASVVKSVSDGQTTWEDVWSRFPHQSTASADE
ncbi:Glycine--tRNA ligase, mitochondrial 1 [Linum perenne]